jgi:hypothetical protein
MGFVMTRGFSAVAVLVLAVGCAFAAAPSINEFFEPFAERRPE